MTGFAFGSRNINIDKPMSRQLKVTYLDICQNSDRNIYQVARNINRPYNRVYADVKRLQEIGLQGLVINTDRQEGIDTQCYLALNQRTIDC